MNSLKKQAGINLIELMIVGFLMVLVGFFVIKIMTSSNEAASRSEGVAQAQETARLTMEWLFESTARAGYPASSNISGSQTRIQPFADLCTGSATPPEPGGNCTFESNDPNVNDRIAVMRTYAALGDSDDARDWVDCTGVDLNGVGLTSQDTILVDVYWVERNNGTDGDDYDDVLRCVTYNNETGTVLNPPQTIASGVEGLQVLYGIDGLSPFPPDATPVISSYISADLIVDDQWNLVYAARVAILARGFSDHSLTQATRSYILLDANPYTFNDRVPRQIISSTIFLKNQ